MTIESSSASINALFKQEKWAKAKKLIEKELAKTPDSHWLLDRLSVVYYEQRQYNEARTFIERAYSIKPDCPLVLWDYAGTLAALDLTNEALGLYTQLINAYPDKLLHDECGEDLVNAWLPAGSPCTELKALADDVAAEDPECDAQKLAEKVREMVTEPDIPDIVPNVRIMSLHKSKALNANVIIVAGCVEGVVPRLRQDDMTDADYAESIEEYRRLFFVGVTRVKAAPTEGRPGHLIISASRKVPTAIAMKGVAIAGREGWMARTINSGFLSELGADSPRPVTPELP